MLSHMTYLVNATIHVCTCLWLYIGGGTPNLSIHPLSFIKDTLSAKAFTLPTANMHSVFKHLSIHAYAYYDDWQYGSQWDMIEVIIALAFNNNHIICYHMDMQWSVGLRWCYFVSPDYVVVQCWVHSTFFHPDTINPMGLPIYCYTMFLEGIVGYNAIGISFTWLTAVINYANAQINDFSLEAN